MPSNALPPLFANTKNDHGAIPVVMAYIGASITVLVSAIRLGLTWKKKHELRGDDYCFVVGALLAVATSVLLERAVDEGLGRHANTLMISQLNTYAKFIYSTSLLAVVSQAAAKLSVAFLYERIAPWQDKKGIALVLSAIGVWIVFALFGTAFECGVQIHWGAQCSAGAGVDFVIIALNFITDLMLALCMIPRIWNLQARSKDRILPIMLIGSRVFVCVLQLAQLGVLGRLQTKHLVRGADETWTQVTLWTIAISIVHLSIITATIPRINSFMADVQTRQAGLALTQRDYENYVKSTSNGASENGSKNWPRGKKDDSRGPFSSFRPDRVVEQHNTAQGGNEIEMDVRDIIETSSQSSLQRNVVYQKTEFNWEEEYNDHRRV